MNSGGPSTPSSSGPEGYVRARDEAQRHADASPHFTRVVERRPYLPLLRVDPSDQTTVVHAAKVVVACHNATAENDAPGASSDEIMQRVEGKVTVITGGLTNALFKVDLAAPATNSDDSAASSSNATSVLVRVFGAEGMIDRDVETTHFARLCHRRGTIVHSGLDMVGRFGNGRVETWIPNMRQAHHIHDFGKEGLAIEVARQLARLHYGFDAHVTEAEDEPSLWGVIASWIEELAGDLSKESFGGDARLLELFARAILPCRQEAGPCSVDEIKAALHEELEWLRTKVETDFLNAPVVFCHTDVNAANIILNASIDNSSDDNEQYDRESVCIIDYEYGSNNYAMYDVANLMCEHCGGNDNGIPDYDLSPSSEWLETFLNAYVKERDEILTAKGSDGAAAASSEAQSVSDLRSQAELFQLGSNLYWGLWGILQAAGEVADGTFVAEGAEARLAGKSELEK